VGAYIDPGQTYDESFTYDANGNITTVERFGWSGYGEPATFRIDNLAYNYDLDTNNQLQYITDTAGAFGQDLDTQSAGNYQYDEEGKLIADAAEGLAITWNNLNKVHTVTNSATGTNIKFSYNALGHRVVKRVQNPVEAVDETTWYIRDVQGNIMAIYSRTFDVSSGEYTTKLAELPLYGSSRIGVYRPDLVIPDIAASIPETPTKLDTVTELNNWLVATAPGADGKSGAHLAFSRTSVDLMSEPATHNLTDDNLFMGINVAVAEDEDGQKVFEFFVSNRTEDRALVVGVLGEYFNNTNLTGAPRIIRTDPKIDFSWFPENTPVPGVIDPAGFSVRWTAEFFILNPLGDDYQFKLDFGGGVRLHVDGHTIIDDWNNIDGSITATSATINLGSGYHPIVVEYFNRTNPFTPGMNFPTQITLSVRKKNFPPIPVESWGDWYVPESGLYHYAPDISWLLNNQGEVSDEYHDIRATRETQSAVIKAPGEYNDKYFLFTGYNNNLLFNTIHADPYYAVLNGKNQAVPGLTLADVPHPYALAVYNDLSDPERNRLFVAVNTFSPLGGSIIEIREHKITDDGPDAGRVVETITTSALDTLDLGEMQVSPNGTQVALSYSKKVGSDYKHLLVKLDLTPANGQMLTVAGADVALASVELAREDNSGIVKAYGQKLRQRVMSFDYSPSGKFIYYLKQGCTDLTACYAATAKPVQLMRQDLETAGETPRLVFPDVVERFQGAVRRGKNGQLFVNVQLARPPPPPLIVTQKLLSFSNLEAAAVGSVIQGELPHNKGKNRFGLPLQTYRINPQPIETDRTFLAERKLEDKLFEVTDHLQNIRATLSDARLATLSSGTLTASFSSGSSWTDYYAFGMNIPGRALSTSGYRFGFNGMEKDDGVKGAGNSYITEFRSFDSRVGRWLSPDPKFRVNVSPYNGLDDNPALFVDTDGRAAESKIVLWGTNYDEGALQNKWANPFAKRARALRSKIDGFKVRRIQTGDQIILQLKNASSSGPIKHAVILSHGNSSGILLKNNKGFYADNTGKHVRSASLEDLKTAVESEEIKFAENSVVEIMSCNCASQDFASELAKITKGVVIAAKGFVAPESQGETSNFVSKENIYNRAFGEADVFSDDSNFTRYMWDEATQTVIETDLGHQHEVGTDSNEAENIP